MRNYLRILGLIFTLALGGVFSSGCAIGLGKSMHQFAQLDYEETGKLAKVREVTALGEKTVILFFTFNTDYADEAYVTLLSKCPGGRISNVKTKFSSDLGFLAYKNKVELTGDCIGG